MMAIKINDLLILYAVKIIEKPLFCQNYTKRKVNEKTFENLVFKNHQFCTSSLSFVCLFSKKKIGTFT